ncbi:MAG: lipid II flippase MurJ [Actinomycetota bacterium]
MTTERRSSLVGDSAASAVWTLASRVSGFGRVILIGAVLGPTYFGNLFQLANQLPWIVFELAVGSLLHALLVPVLMRSITAGDLRRTEQVAGSFLSLVLAGFTAITLAVVAGSYLLARLFALPVADAGERGDFIAAAVPLIVLTAPQLVGYGIAMTGQAVQQAMGRFALPAAAGIAENAVVIATLALYALWYGTGPALAEIDTPQLLLLGGGSTLGVAVHAAIQLWGMRRAGLRVRPRLAWREPEIIDVVRRAVPSSGTAVLNSLRFLVLLVAANAVPGGVVAFQLALNALNLPVALGAKPVAYAALPRLSTLHQEGRIAEFLHAYRKSVLLAFCILAPAAAGALLLGRFAAGGIAVGEMATPDGRALIGATLVGICGAIVGDGLYQVATSGTYARDDATGPLKALAIRFGVTVVGAALATVFFSGATVLLVMAVMMSLGDLAGSIMLHRRVTTGLPRHAPSAGRSVTALVLAAFASFAIVAFMTELGDTIVGLPTAPGAVLVLTGVLVAGALALYGGLALRFTEEFGPLLAELRAGRQGVPEEAPAL